MNANAARDTAITDLECAAARYTAYAREEFARHGDNDPIGVLMASTANMLRNNVRGLTVGGESVAILTYAAGMMEDEAGRYRDMMTATTLSNTEKARLEGCANGCAHAARIIHRAVAKYT